MKPISGNDLDREFFKATPGRRYRLRLAAADELDWFLENEPPPPKDFFLYAVVYQPVPGKRISCLVALRSDEPIADTEETARSL
jgi:hypothetical protein